MSGDGDPAAVLGLNLDQLPGAGLALGLDDMDGSTTATWLAFAQASGQSLTDLARGIEAMADAVEQARRQSLPTVHEALARIKAELPGIGKTETSPEGYDYRGIEAIARHLQALEGRHGVMVVPTCTVRSVAQVPNMKEGWTDTVMDVEWTITGPRGDVYLIPSTTPGEPPRLPITHGVGRDKTDKGAAKALTQARKQLLIALYQIGDGRDDPDAHAAPGDTEYRDPNRAAAPPPATSAWISETVRDRLRGRALALPEAQRNEFTAEWMHEDPSTGETLFPTEERGGKVRPAFHRLTTDIVAGVEAMLTRYERAAQAAQGQGAATPAGSTPPGPDAPPTGADTGQAPPEAQAATQRPRPSGLSWAGMQQAWRSIVEAMRVTPEQDLRAEFRRFPHVPVPDGAQAMRGELAALEGEAAGLPPFGYLFGPGALADPLPEPDGWSPGDPVPDPLAAAEAAADAAYQAAADEAERRGDASTAVDQ